MRTFTIIIVGLLTGIILTSASICIYYELTPDYYLNVSYESHFEVQDEDTTADDLWNPDFWWRQRIEGDTWVDPESYCNFSATLYAATLNTYPPRPDQWDGVYVLYFRVGRHTVYTDFYEIIADEPVLNTETYALDQNFWTSGNTIEFNAQELEEAHNADPANAGHLVDLSLAEGEYTYFFSHGEADRNINDPTWEFEGPKINNYIIIKSTWEEEPVNPIYKYITFVLLGAGLVIGIIGMRTYMKRMNQKLMVMQENYIKLTHPQICKDGSNTICKAYGNNYFIATNTYEPYSCRCIPDTPENRKEQGYHSFLKDKMYRVDPIIDAVEIRKWF